MLYLHGVEHLLVEQEWLVAVVLGSVGQLIVVDAPQVVVGQYLLPADHLVDARDFVAIVHQLVARQSGNHHLEYP